LADFLGKTPRSVTQKQARNGINAPFALKNKNKNKNKSKRERHDKYWKTLDYQAGMIDNVTPKKIKSNKVFTHATGVIL
jgi:hypothetical protein